MSKKRLFIVAMKARRKMLAMATLTGSWFGPVFGNTRI
jgi:hypothetical protein